MNTRRWRQKASILRFGWAEKSDAELFTNEEAGIASTARNLSLEENAKLSAALDSAIVDARIAAWQSKFTQLQSENGRSRIYLGVHWANDDFQGQSLGFGFHLSAVSTASGR